MGEIAVALSQGEDRHGGGVVVDGGAVAGDVDGVGGPILSVDLAREGLHLGDEGGDVVRI